MTTMALSSVKLPSILGRGRSSPTSLKPECDRNQVSFVDTYQVVAHKALWYLCQIYEEPIAHTPMRFFPPLEKNRWAWRARMEAL